MSDNPDPEIAFEAGEQVTSLLRFEIQVLRNMACDWEKASEMEFLEAKMCIDLKSKLSVNLQTLLRTAPASIKALWNAMEVASKKAVNPGNVAADVVNCLEDMKEAILDKASENPETVESLKMLLRSDCPPAR